MKTHPGWVAFFLFGCYCLRPFIVEYSRAACLTFNFGARLVFKPFRYVEKYFYRLHNRRFVCCLLRGIHTEGATARGMPWTDRGNERSGERGAADRAKSS